MFTWLKEWLGICPEGGTMESYPFHDWEYIERTTAGEVSYDMDCKRFGRRLPRAGQHGYDRLLYHRVCLCCERQDNTIQEFRDEYSANLSHRDYRQRIAKSIIDHEQAIAQPEHSGTAEPQR
jgi:hypothetical protein